MTRIKVTQEDIDNGKPDLCSKCPIALAAQRTFNNPRARVNTLTIILPDRLYTNLTKRYFLPIEAINFISNFDRGKEVKPFEFVVTNI